ncbi:MAG: PKD domain-containing protein [Actinomycetota bacterium]|nr:PKD domain-containing protein [Actinomycetota bacterium]
MTYGATAPTASFTYSPASPTALDPVSFDASSSHDNNTGGSITGYTLEFGDGGSWTLKNPTHKYSAAGTFTVTLTVQDSAGLKASQSQNVTVGLRPTTLAYTGPTSGKYNHPATLSAKLTDNETNSGVSGQLVTLAIGSQNCTALTDGAGTVSCSITLTQTPGSRACASCIATSNASAPKPRACARCSRPRRLERDAGRVRGVVWRRHMKAVLFCESAEDVGAKAPPHFPAHLPGSTSSTHGKRSHGRPLRRPAGRRIDGRLRDPAAAEAFVEGDPFVRDGVVQSWVIRDWNEMLVPSPEDHGTPAARPQPVRPSGIGSTTSAPADRGRREVRSRSESGTGRAS